jgi:hypothetical protein
MNSYDFAVLGFKEYLKKRENWRIVIHGEKVFSRKKFTRRKKFTFKKTDVHRWKDGYLKKRLARLYKLRDWFNNLPSHEITMVTLTVPHNENKWGEKVNFGHDIYQAWKNLKQGWNRIRMCPIFRNRDFVIIYEPHKSGYPHAHLMVFDIFTDREIEHLKNLWSEMTGADLKDGVSVRPGVGVNYLIAYLVKYMSKTLYHTIESWTPGEWLFNAIAHEKRYRLFGSSNNLAKVMRLVTDSDNSIVYHSVFLEGLTPRWDNDTICSSRIWLNSKCRLKRQLLEPCDPISTADRVAVWKLKNNIIDSPDEIAFKLGLRHGKNRRKTRKDRISVSSRLFRS